MDANARFKQSFGARVWSGMIVATVLHFALFALWPTMSVEELAASMDAPEIIDLPPDVEIPEAPERIERPARPVLSDTELDEDVTIASTRIEDYRPSDLAPPTGSAGSDSAAVPIFAPYTVAPRLLNPDEVERALRTQYPSSLRDAGIGGEVSVLVAIDETGAVLQARVHEGSGYEALDAAALAVVQVMRFTAALNMDTPVPVQVRQTVTFVSRRSPEV